MLWEIRNARELGAFIRDARAERSLTQHQLADRAGVSRSWLIGVEQGKRTGAEMSKIFALMKTLDTAIFCESPDDDWPVNPRGEAPTGSDATDSVHSRDRRDDASTFRDSDIDKALDEHIAYLTRPSGITTAPNKRSRGA